MLNLSLEETMKKHKQLWENIAEIIKEDNESSGLMLKIKALKRMGVSSSSCPLHHCYLCDYVLSSNTTCGFGCPCYDSNLERDLCLNGLYNIFKNKPSIETALIIANLSVTNENVLKKEER